MSFLERLSIQSLIGGVIVLSTPISGLFSFAIGSVVFGEPALEHQGGDQTGLTGLGVLFILIPAMVGIGLIVADVFSGRRRTLVELIWQEPRTAGLAAAFAGFVLIAISFLSLFLTDTVGPNIGAGLLFMAGGVLVVIGFGFYRFAPRHAGRPM